MPVGYVVSVGEEILTGRTLDRNSNHLALTLTGTGVDVRGIAVVPDDAARIAAAIKNATAGIPSLDLIVTSGGLGATPDDLTLEAVALALAIPFEHSAEAHALVESRYREVHREAGVESDPPDEAVLKLSTMPHGAELVPNAVEVAARFSEAAQAAGIGVLGITEG